MPSSSGVPDEMHRRVSWMMAADESILRFLYASRDERGAPSIQTPNTIHLNTGYSRQHASTRAKVLADHGLVDRVDGGQYRLTEFGEQFLDQEVPLEELEDDDENDENDENRE